MATSFGTADNGWQRKRPGQRAARGGDPQHNNGAGERRLLPRVFPHVSLTNIRLAPLALSTPLKRGTLCHHLIFDCSPKLGIQQKTGEGALHPSPIHQTANPSSSLLNLSAKMAGSLLGRKIFAKALLALARRTRESGVSGPHHDAWSSCKYIIYARLAGGPSAAPRHMTNGRTTASSLFFSILFQRVGDSFDFC